MKIENPTALLVMLTLAFVAPTAAGEPGDANCDGQVNWFDTEPFAMAVMYPDVYLAAYPYCDLDNSNLNPYAAGYVNLFDVDGWYNCVYSPVCGSEPPPWPPADEFALRLFFSTAGLVDPADPSGPVESPILDTDHNVAVATSMGPRRLYVWAQMVIPEAQTWQGISFDVNVTGSTTIVDWDVWNAQVQEPWQNRWYQGWGTDPGQLGAGGTSVTNVGIMALTEEYGISNDLSVPPDPQLDAATSAVPIAWFEFAGEGDVYLSVGERGIARRHTGGPNEIYLGWGDEDDGLLGDSFNVSSSLADAHLIDAQPCDLNCDGLVNAFDIDPFVLALVDPAAYVAAYPMCDRLLADISGDGFVNSFDIDPFVQCMLEH